jgi:hypothetical protein
MDWIVLVEVAAPPGEVVDLARLEHLLDGLTEFESAGLYSADRYAVQLATPANGPVEALEAAVHCVLGGAERTGLPDRIVRAQAMTPDELATEVAVADGEMHLLLDPLDAAVLPAVHEATRVLVRATTPRQVAESVIRLVQRLGGRVGPYAGADVGAFRLGVELVPGEPLAAFSDDDDTWVRLAEALPAVLDDVRLVLARLEPAPAAAPG